MRILGLDYGDARIGVAISDMLGWTAQGLTVIPRKNPIDLKHSIAEIAKISADYQVKTIVVGYPKNMNNTEGESCAKVLAFKKKLAKAVPDADVVLFDERLTTVMAQRMFADADEAAGKRRNNVDKVAASLILQGYLDRQKNNTLSGDKETTMDLENSNSFDENDDLEMLEGEMEFETIVMTDEDGNDVEYVIIDEFIHEDVNYLIMVQADNADDDEAEAVIFKQVEASDEEFIYEEIDENEYNNLEPILKVRLEELDIDIQ